MNNKKTLWLGLVAILTVTSILVANLAMSPGAQPETPGPSAPPPVSEPLPFLGPPQADSIKTENNPPALTPIAAPGGKMPPRQEATQASNTGRAVVVEFETPGAAQSLAFPSGTPPPQSIPMRNSVGKIRLTALEEPKKIPETAPVPAPPTPPGPLSAFLREQKLGEQPSGTGGTVPAAQISGPTTSGASGVGDLLTKSNSALGVEVQKRSPLVGDPRIEGLHFGQIVTQADGAYWFPARVDLDTVISKLNSNNIDNIIIIKGPFSVRYGPGFSFLDIESLPTPRNKEGGFDAHGSTSLNYRTNSQGVQGQQSFWGGNADWGFRMSYDIQSAGDYASGNGTKLPSSFNTHFFNFAYGMDLSSTSSIEVKYLHVQQSNVLFPGLLTDINGLTTEAFSARYKATEGGWYDQLTLDTWVNTTKFNGDSANPETRRQIPQLDNIFPALSAPTAQFPNGQFRPVRLDITTDGYAISYGLRETTTWGDVKGFNVSLGADIKVFMSYYNEYDAFNLSVPSNLGIPNARQVDPGIFLDSSIPIGEDLTLKAGARVDFVSTQFINFGPSTDVALYNANVGDPQGNKNYFLFAGFLTGEYKISKEWTAQAGYGYAQRPPTLTELYTGGAFLGLIQNGLNSIYGNLDLRKEEMHQINLGLKGKYEDVRVGGSAFYGFLPNYITYQNQGPFTLGQQFLGATTPINRLKFINTNWATLYGFDAYGEYDALPWLTPFATLSFVEGWDQQRNEALPGIPPLSTRVGVRFHDPSKEQKWGVEYFVRMVAAQNLFAGSLGEAQTGGFGVHNIRAYWQATKSVLLLAGVENIGNLQYREHLDLRTGSGVFQPGINFYFGVKANY